MQRTRMEKVLACVPPSDPLRRLRLRFHALEKTPLASKLSGTNVTAALSLVVRTSLRSGLRCILCFGLHVTFRPLFCACAGAWCVVQIPLPGEPGFKPPSASAATKSKGGAPKQADADAAPPTKDAGKKAAGKDKPKKEKGKAWVKEKKVCWQ